MSSLEPRPVSLHGNGSSRFFYVAINSCSEWWLGIWVKLYCKTWETHDTYPSFHIIPSLTSCDENAAINAENAYHRLLAHVHVHIHCSINSHPNWNGYADVSTTLLSVAAKEWEGEWHIPQHVSHAIHATTQTSIKLLSSVGGVSLNVCAFMEGGYRLTLCPFTHSPLSRHVSWREQHKSLMLIIATLNKFIHLVLGFELPVPMAKQASYSCTY